MIDRRADDQPQDRAGARSHDSADTGFVEGQNTKIEYRWADNHLDRLPGLVADLIRRQVSVIVGNSQAAEAAKTATSTIPIVFVTGDDPVTRGLVGSLGRPSGTVTGITFSVPFRQSTIAAVAGG